MTFYYLSPVSRTDSSHPVDPEEYPDSIQVGEIEYILAGLIWKYGEDQVRDGLENTLSIIKN